MWLKWLPWRFIVRRVARSHGFVDPVSVLARLQQFAEPAEVAAPLELLRAGVVFHARGLMNSAVIQHNLDWIWPYWAERQFDPHDRSFLPRAFSITHVNLTHRNWTAVGLPDYDHLPIVDPRGLLTPFWDGWSLDAWIVGEDGRRLAPSQLPHVEQRLDLSDGLAVITEAESDGFQLRAQVEALAPEQVDRHNGSLTPWCRQQIRASSHQPAWLAVVLRPYNPEGVSFVHEVALSDDRRSWLIEERRTVEFSDEAESHRVSRYKLGDVHPELAGTKETLHARCEVGMATAAALFRIQPGQTREIAVSVPLSLDPSQSSVGAHVKSHSSWSAALEQCAKLTVPDERYQLLYDAALRTLVLHAPPGEVYPGPYTYKRFWFRDAAFILNALLLAGLDQRVRRVLDSFPQRQNRRGYFLSQEGEWDSNGAALWIMQRYCQLTRQRPPEEWMGPVVLGARWIGRKRVSDASDRLHAGLLPAGFSAEHLGPNDYYYWDDYWGVAGLNAAAELCSAAGDSHSADAFRRESAGLMAAIDRSLLLSGDRRRGHELAIPASPYRRMDSGAIGSVVAGYPLQLVGPDDPRLLRTVDFLLAECSYAGGFFQDMIHSGINAYLTLHLAQVLLRAEDPRALELMRVVADLASPTGQWPEAIHPHTGGGCMGDGQHVWAAAEWVSMIRNCFVREEGETLVVAAGIPAAWLEQSSPISFGPTPTPWGDVHVSIDPGDGHAVVACHGQWPGGRPRIEVALADRPRVELPDGEHAVTLERAHSL